MEFTIRLFTAVIFWTGFNVVCCSKVDDICPRNGGTWSVDNKEGDDRCILSCSDGYVPSGCQVIRLLPEGGYNKPIPICEKASSIVSGYTLVKVGAGIAAVVVVQYALTVIGFGTVGVAACSLAAWLQGPLTVAGSWFAVLQSAGATGLALTTQLGIGSLGYMAFDYVMNVFKDCEYE